ncbi:hypothetical protein HZC35_01140 [Candidatus Saganbacteria bacterium]|nr:hypothetical protein [Candidatus Saganbacteria bacterium]
MAPKVIEMDDAGSGSLYGGVLILATDGRHDFTSEVPLSAFNVEDKRLRNQKIAESVGQIALLSVRKLRAEKNTTEFHLCQGNILDAAERSLKEAGFKVIRQKIEGRTNLEAEKLFKILLKDKYNVANYNPKDYAGENLRQFALLKHRRDFENVKNQSKGVLELRK